MIDTMQIRQRGEIMEVSSTALDVLWDAYLEFQKRDLTIPFLNFLFEFRQGSADSRACPVESSKRGRDEKIYFFQKKKK